MFIFFLLSPSARLQVLFFLLPFARPFRCWFEYMFTSRRLCAILGQCTITLSLYRYPLSVFLFVLFNCKGSLSSIFCLLACDRSSLLALKVIQFLYAAREQKVPCYEPHVFNFLYKESCYSTKDNQVTRSEVILLQDPTEKCSQFHFAACEKVRWQVEKIRVCRSLVSGMFC